MMMLKKKKNNEAELDIRVNSNDSLSWLDTKTI